MNTARDILQFWFAGDLTTERPAWFQKDVGFDAEIAARFGTLLAPAREGRLDEWTASAEGTLALLVLLDQFPRNLHRGDAMAFAADPKARAVARHAVLEARQDTALPPAARAFLYLPFEHSESLADQDLSVALFEGMRDHPPARRPGGTIDYAWKHRAVIARFGRFPHRNAALGRPDTAAESAYLALPGAGF